VGLAWIETEVAVIRFGAGGVYHTRPAHGLVAARFRHYEARCAVDEGLDDVSGAGRGRRQRSAVKWIAWPNALVHDAARPSSGGG
jgi:hypothetical protein